MIPGRSSIPVALLACLLWGTPSSLRAQATAPRPSPFVPAHELFRRLLADPRQAQTSLRYYRIEGRNFGDVALGNTWGLSRWEWGGWRFQSNVEGMAYSRFKLSGSVNEFQTVDFFANIPLEARRGAWSARTTLFHESSHLGDDYIRRTNDLGFRYSIEGLRLVGSLEPWPWLRAYGGGTGLLHAVPYKQDGALQAGFELRSKELACFAARPCQAYLGHDLQFKGRSRWNPSAKTELGMKFAFQDVIRFLRVHAGYFTGRSEFGQFFRRKENYFDAGVSFDF